jgi:hypothetical protein
MSGERRGTMGEPVYFWFYVCERGCSMEKTSTEPLGIPSWTSEKCPLCGAAILEVNMKGPEEGGK